MNSEIISFINSEMDKRFEGMRIMVEGMINEYLLASGKPAMKTQQVIKAKQIKLNNFCQENYNYLLIPYLSSVIKSCTDMNAILQKVITDLYFHPDRKANHIIYIPYSNNSYRALTVYIDGDWKNFDLNTTLEKIVRRGNDVLQHYIIGSDQEDEDKFRKEVGNKKYELLKDFTNKIDNMDDDEEFRDKLLLDTEKTIISYQHTVHKHIFAGTTPDVTP